MSAVRRSEFEFIFESIRDELLHECKNRGLPPEAIEWYRRNLDYNVPGGKLNRGLSVIDSCEILKGDPLSSEEFFKAAVLGWCIELLQAFFLVSDDIMDSSITRRGQPCWYRAEAPTAQNLVGNVAINDSFLLEGAIYEVLKKHFRGDSCYLDILELFHDCTYKTEQGQLVDLITAPEGVVDLGRFSFERHRFIVEYKTSYYSFYLPVAAAMRLCNIPDSYIVKVGGDMKTVEAYKLALSILLPIGEYFQIQDDFLDYSARPEELGKIGTDIVDNKCSWCINMVLSRCSPEQRLVLERNYGRKGDIEASGENSQTFTEAGGQVAAGGLCEQRVKDVYEAVGLRKIYSDYEQGVYKDLSKLIESIPENGIIVNENGVKSHVGLKKMVFKSFLDKIYRRCK